MSCVWVATTTTTQEETNKMKRKVKNIWSKLKNKIFWERQFYTRYALSKHICYKIFILFFFFSFCGACLVVYGFQSFFISSTTIKWYLLSHALHQNAFFLPEVLKTAKLRQNYHQTTTKMRLCCSKFDKIATFIQTTT